MLKKKIKPNNIWNILGNDFIDLIQMAEKFYDTIAIGMKNENIVKDIISE